MQESATTDLFCLDHAYSTTRLVTRKTPIIENFPDAKCETVLVSQVEPKGENCLRFQGWFKKNLPDKPLITVITVVLNGEKYLEDTIRSVLNQTYDNVEYIVIDGESTDGTKNIVQRYGNMLDVFVCERDDGVYDAMNKAIARACGEFILFMNCGDVFASPDAISSAMSFVQPGGDQILFGHWLRRTGDKLLRHCRPVLEKGVFNHQAVIYSRRIHAWHGGYVNVKGLTTADYLFFATLFNSAAVKCRIIETTIATIDTNGLSAGHQTLSQKYAIDYICGRVGKVRLLMVLAAHPVYVQIKALWRRLR